MKMTKFKIVQALGLAAVGLGLFSSVARADLDDEIEQGQKPPESGTTPLPSARPTNNREGNRPIGPSPGDKKAPGPEQTKDKSPQKSGQSTSANKGQEPVKFQSSGLTGFKDQGTMELVNDVVITQGDTKMEADKVKAFYDQKSKEVVKIVASGNVKIFKDDPDPTKKVRSTSQEAIFFNKDRKVVLKGNPQLIRNGGDIVRGKEITYELDTGWMRVDRVEGVLVPQSQQPTPVASPLAMPSRTKSPAPTKTPGNKK